jgi:hypothetical protein
VLFRFYYLETKTSIALKEKNCTNFVSMERGYFQNREFNVKGLNIKPIRDELQALKNVRDFCCLK